MGKQRKVNTPEKRARVGERIKVAATQAGLSLKELAEQVGVSPSTVYQYVRGITALAPGLLERIALVTRVHTSFFDPEMDARQTLALPLDSSALEPGTPALAFEKDTRSRIEAELRQTRLLADAYGSAPATRLARLSSLEHMLALSRAIDNREQSAAILAQIGKLRLAEGHFQAARANLLEARELVTEQQSALWAEITIDLAHCCCRADDSATATTYLEQICADQTSAARWRAEILLGTIRYRTGDYAGALTRYGHAAEAVMAQNSAQVERDAQTPLAIAVAQLAYGTGHFEASRALWNYAAHRAELECDVETYLDVRTEMARCEAARGDLPAARACLESVLVLTSFLPDTQNSQLVARGLLAGICASLGAREALLENARLALRSAHKMDRTADAVAVSLALARIRLAGDQFGEALGYADEALDLARRVERPAEEANAHVARALAHYGQNKPGGADDEVPGLETGLRRALLEARSAAEAAERGRDQVVRLEAQWLMAEVYMAIGAHSEAESVLARYLEMVETGPVALRGLLNTGTNSLLALLSAEIDLPGLFQAGTRIDLPLVEWQIHVLRGILASATGESGLAYDSYLEAAHLVARLLSRLSAAETRAFVRRNRHFTELMVGLEWAASSVDFPSQARALLDRIGLLTEQAGDAVVGAESIGGGRLVSRH